MATQSELSVVIITRNEATKIATCIESVLDEIRGLYAEVLLVDSASTDGTLEIARKFPITIVRLDPSNVLSPSAGRFVGTRLAQGRLLFFVDGDMTVHEGWLREALPRFEDQTLGALAGRVLFVPPGESSTEGIPDSLPLGSVPGIGGTGVYRHDILQAVGSFNPYLRGEEERELGHRIATMGFRILRVPFPMASHFSKHRTADELEEKSLHFTGVGQILRHYGLGKISREILASQLHVFVPSLIVLVALATMAFLLLAGHHTASLSLFSGIALVAGLILVRKGVHRSLRFLGFNVLTLGRGFQGFLIGLKDPEEYWKRVKFEILQDGSIGR